jgi:hypothetical protein
MGNAEVRGNTLFYHGERRDPGISDNEIRSGRAPSLLQFDNVRPQLESPFIF